LVGTLFADKAYSIESAAHGTQTPQAQEITMLMKTTAEQRTNICRDEPIANQGIKAPGKIHSDSHTFNFKDDLPEFQADILRRYEAPFCLDGWLHKGLNH
jgi:hypothetical protein